MDMGVHPNQVGQWKKELPEQVVDYSTPSVAQNLANPSASPERLYSEIGQLMMELDWLKKSQGYAGSSAQTISQHL